MSVFRAPLFPKATPRDLAAWWLWLAELRKRVAVAFPRLSTKAHQRHIVAEAEGYEWMELYRPLSEQRWELLRLKASERAERCTTCNGRRHIRTREGKRACPSCKGSGQRQETKACAKSPDGFHDFEWNDALTCIHCGLCPDDDRRAPPSNAQFLSLSVRAP